MNSRAVNGIPPSRRRPRCLSIPKRLTECREEWAHCAAHAPEILTEPVCRGIKEVEAESIAFIVADTLGIDTSTYSFPYVAHWAAGVGDLAAVQATAERVIAHARKILNGLDT